MMDSSILSQEWFWGVLLGATLTFISQLIYRSIQKKEERRIAAMQVATLLRGWLADCESAVLDHENWWRSNGQMGRNLSKFPELNIEQSLDQIVRLKPCEAKATFELIQKTRDTEISAVFMADAVGGEEATDWLHKECGALFIDGLEIHRQLAKNVKWKETPFSENVIQKMTELADRSRRSD